MVLFHVVTRLLWMMKILSCLHIRASSLSSIIISDEGILQSWQHSSWPIVRVQTIFIKNGDWMFLWQIKRKMGDPATTLSASFNDLPNVIFAFFVLHNYCEFHGDDWRNIKRSKCADMKESFNHLIMLLFMERQSSQWSYWETHSSNFCQVLSLMVALQTGTLTLFLTSHS